MIRVFAEYIKWIFLAVFVASFVRFAVCSPFKVSSHLMAPSLVSGDFVLVYKWPFVFQKIKKYLLSLNSTNTKNSKYNRYPAKGTVVAFHCGKLHGRVCLSRVIGHPGDRIEWKKQRLYINRVKADYKRVAKGHSLLSYHGIDVMEFEEKLPDFSQKIWLYPSKKLKVGPISPHVVPPGHVFVFNDFRSLQEGHSMAREILPTQNLIGSVSWVLFSLEWVPSDEGDGDLRWNGDRFLKRVLTSLPF